MNIVFGTELYPELAMKYRWREDEEKIAWYKFGNFSAYVALHMVFFFLPLYYLIFELLG